MHIELNAEMQKYVGEKVQRGEFDSTDEAVDSLLAGIKEREELTPDEVAAMRAAIQVGIDEADRGEFVEFTAEDIIAEGKAARASRKKVS